MAFVPLAVTLLPLIPQFVNTVLNLVDAVRRDPGLPEEDKALLDALSADLAAINMRVQAVELPTQG